MKYAEISKIAFTSLISNKLRSSLTILGIVVGIFSIITISTVISMVQSSIESGTSFLGQNTFQVQKWPAVRTGGSGDWKKYRNRKNIELDEFYELKEKLTDSKSLAATVGKWGVVLKNGSEKTNPNVSIEGVTPEAFVTHDWNVTSGRAFNYNELQRGENIIVLGADVARKLFKYENPVDREISLDGRKLRVIGVLEDKGEVFGQSTGNFAIIPISTFKSYYGLRRRSISISVMAFGRGDYNDLMVKAEGALRTIRKVPAGDDNDFEIISNESILGQINNITASFRIGAFAIAAIALFAAGVGIMNIMLVSVTERTKEIGVRKAIGAKRRNILVQFIVEAVTLCLVGGLIGIIFGVITGNIVGLLMKAQITIPIGWITVGMLLCVGIGVLFGTYPAYKAANLDPIEALRFE